MSVVVFALCGRYKFPSSIAASSSSSTASLHNGVAQASTEDNTFASGFLAQATADSKATVITKKCFVKADSDSIALVKFHCGKAVADAYAKAFAAGKAVLTDTNSWAKVFKVYGCKALSSADAYAKAIGCY